VEWIADKVSYRVALLKLALSEIKRGFIENVAFTEEQLMFFTPEAVTTEALKSLVTFESLLRFATGYTRRPFLEPDPEEMCNNCMCLGSPRGGHRPLLLVGV
jgi:hypothetical protein